MKYRWDKKYLYWGLTAFFVIIASVLFYTLASNYPKVFAAASVLFDILLPLILGFVFAYLLNPIMVFCEKKCFAPLMKKSKAKNPAKIVRVFALIVTIIFALALIFGLCVLVIPQLAKSIDGIIKNLSTYFKNLENWATSLVSSNKWLESFITQQFENINLFITDWAKNNLAPQINSILAGVTSGVIGAVVFLKNFLIALVLSVYILYSKERFVSQAKKLLYSIFSIPFANRAIKVTRHSHRVFGGFITGKLIDSLIIGCMCFVGMSIFKMPFALLISVIIGITNIIPFFGPIIGAIPCGLLLLMIDPLTCLYFVIFIIILQQFDGNILGPMILGDSTGLTAFWVIFAILFSGGLFGFVGMVIGVPAFAVIYSLINDAVNTRLEKKKLLIKTSDYIGLDYIVPEDLTPIYNEDTEEQMKIKKQSKKK